MASERSRVTASDVAKLVGVHVSTVSRAMNPQTRGLVAGDVAQRVLAAAASLGYAPNSLAAGLRTRRSFTIGVVLPDITNPVFPPILRGIQEVLEAEGYVPIVADAGPEAGRPEAGRPEAGRRETVVERLIARQVDGLILATSLRHDPVLTLCRARQIPVVLVNRVTEDSGFSGVVSDDQRGMKLAVDHLAALGHRSIGHISGPLELSTGHGRLQGFRQAMAQQGLAVPADAVTTAAAYSRDAGREATNRLLTQAPGLTAIVAANDLLALGCYDALAAAGLDCPGDMSVVGHNDMPLVDMVDPPLTTVRIRHHEMGTEAARLLLRQIAGAAEGFDLVLRPDLIVRASTAPPR
ncbi:HTH-type transcriptional regulator MalR [Aliidongia dinghuensis]|uniref:HTH-type transcriptional regulator MalR n=1 Tax=Aliidongia dinghuensis TaxID=1867774 RepID=A0A8J2Z154_9PROT|nr:LacI family DNA-binding transcriptional regulator [Aliidongia dinghuensis]GGF48570.1 HTH-type transcriptional regulator MalR [Aliidongia dinghuensis]